MKKWPLREKYIPGAKNVAHQALVDNANIYLPPFHVKLAIIKQFVKAMSIDGEGLKYLIHKFHRMKEAKRKDGIFFGLQIKQLFLDPTLQNKRNAFEKILWNSFENVTIFLRQQKVSRL